MAKYGVVRVSESDDSFISCNTILWGAASLSRACRRRRRRLQCGASTRREVYTGEVPGKIFGLVKDALQTESRTG